jgi:hypothetical protein
MDTGTITWCLNLTLSRKKKILLAVKEGSDLAPTTQHT